MSALPRASGLPAAGRSGDLPTPRPALPQLCCTGLRAPLQPPDLVPRSSWARQSKCGSAAEILVPEEDAWCTSALLVPPSESASSASASSARQRCGRVDVHPSYAALGQLKLFDKATSVVSKRKAEKKTGAGHYAMPARASVYTASAGTVTVQTQNVDVCAPLGSQILVPDSERVTRPRPHGTET